MSHHAFPPGTSTLDSFMARHPWLHYFWDGGCLWVTWLGCVWVHPTQDPDRD